MADTKPPAFPLPVELLKAGVLLSVSLWAMIEAQEALTDWMRRRRMAAARALAGAPEPARPLNPPPDLTTGADKV